jgi:pyridoxine/pyridoxamine 5'-phosphate oxidase
MPSKDTYGRRKQAQCLACYDDLEGTLAYAWGLLERGVSDRHSPIHTPTVATIGGDGRPSIRTVVLRDCDLDARMLRFHTDRRAPKL